jgi:hypothetical protein
MSDIKTYTAVVTTMYIVHAKNPEEATESIRGTVRGGIFNDNVVIRAQEAALIEPESTFDDSPFNLGKSLLSGDTKLSSVTYFRLGNEQLG